ncbi:hypothetical protein AGLY_000662, partial [Aphis glycines]
MLQFQTLGVVSDDKFSKKSRKIKKSDGKTGIFTQNHFSTKSILLYGCCSKTNHCQYLKFSPNVYTTEIFDFYEIFFFEVHNPFLKAFIVQFFTISVEIAKICNNKISMNFPSSNYRENSKHHYRKNLISIKFFWLNQNTCKFNTKFLISHRNINHLFHQPFERISKADKSSSFRIVFLIHTAPNIHQSGTHLPAFVTIIIEVYGKGFKFFLKMETNLITKYGLENFYIK